jgi:hypothetical protein
LSKAAVDTAKQKKNSDTDMFNIIKICGGFMGYMSKSIYGRMKKRLRYKTTLLKTGISRQHALQVSFTDFQNVLRNGLSNKRLTQFITQSTTMDQYSWKIESSEKF